MAKKNITEIAELAGVSLATVSRVFSNHPNVKEKTRRKILETAHQLNYAPKIAAGKRTVGLLIESLEAIHSDFYLATMLSNIAQQVAVLNLGLELIPIAQIGKLEEHFIRAAIAIPYFEPSIKLLNKIKRTSFVLINEVAEGMSCVGVNHRQGIRLAYEHFDAYGHRNIALLQDYLDGWGNSERHLGFLEVATEHDVADASQRVYFIQDDDSIRLGLRQAVDSGCTAIVISSESSTLRVMREIHRLNIHVPDELSLISYEYSSVSPNLWPAHTTIEQNHAQLAAHAVELAGKILDDELASPIRIMVENQLILRDSVKKL